MSKLKQVGCHIARWPCLFPLPWVPAVAARQLSHLSHASDSLLAPHRSPKRRNLSILEYAAGPGWPVLLTQLAQDFTWLGGNSSEHACITQRAKEGMRQGSMEHTLHHSTNTHTPEHSMHAAWPALNHSDRATGFLYSSSRLPRLCRVQAQWQAGRPVSAPSAHGGPCHWALASQSVQSRRAICHERTENGFSHQVLFACSCFILYGGMTTCHS